MTMNREQKIAEIREALEKATPGPWHMSKLSAGYLVDDRGKDITVFIEYNEDGSVYMEFENWQNNARLIANAPEWLRFLLEERDKLIEGLRKLAKTNAENISEIREWKAKQNDPEVIDLDWYNYVARDILREVGVTVG